MCLKAHRDKTALNECYWNEHYRFTEMLEDIHTCNLDYDMHILYVIEGRQNTEQILNRKNFIPAPLQLLHATLMSFPIVDKNK